MKNLWMIGLMVVPLLAGCAGPKSAPPPGSPPEVKRTVPSVGSDLLAGIWMRQIRDGVNGVEGLILGADGSMSLVGIYSLKGMTWRRSGDTLTLTTQTEKYPEPYPSTFKIGELTDTTLTLSASEDYLAGTYTRERGPLRETVRGKVTGTVTYYQRIALPPQAVLQIRLVDASRQEAPATPLGTQTIARTSQVPIAFDVSYEMGDIQPEHRYEIEARIMADGKTLFLNASPCPVLTQGNPETVEVVVSPAH